MAYMNFWGNCQEKVLQHVFQAEKWLQKICPITLWRSWSNAALIPSPSFFQLFSLLWSLSQHAEQQQWGAGKALVVRLSALDRSCKALMAAQQARKDSWAEIRKKVNCWNMLQLVTNHWSCLFSSVLSTFMHILGYFISGLWSVTAAWNKFSFVAEMGGIDVCCFLLWYC